jgi:hypothetical protein
MPISDEKNASELYFWFFPSTNPKAEKEIVIWCVEANMFAKSKVDYMKVEWRARMQFT